MATMPAAAAQQSAIAQSEDSQVQPSSSTTLRPLPVFELHTGHNETFLPAKTAPILRGFVERKQIDSDTSGDFFRGKVEQNTSPITTVQHKDVAQFQTNFTMLRPLLAPELTREFEAQIARSKPPVDPQTVRAEQQMQTELTRAKPTLQREVSRARPQLAPVRTQGLEAELARSKQRQDPDTARAEQEMQAELARAKIRIQGRQEMAIPSSAIAPNIESELNAEIARGRRQAKAKSVDIDSQIQGESVRAKPQVVPDLDTELRAQLARSKPHMDAELARAKSAMEAVFRHPSMSPQLTTDALTVNPGGAYENSISWDRWYANVAKLSEPRLVKALSRRGNPSGANTVSITVWPNHHLAVRLIQGGKATFDAATLEAYGSLDGNEALIYPAGSRRQEVIFFIDNKHNLPGAVSGVNSQTCVGDKEVQRYKW